MHDSPPLDLHNFPANQETICSQSEMLLDDKEKNETSTSTPYPSQPQPDTSELSSHLQA
jgi:hypothetical protein